MYFLKSDMKLSIGLRTPVVVLSVDRAHCWNTYLVNVDSKIRSYGVTIKSGT